MKKPKHIQCAVPYCYSYRVTEAINLFPDRCESMSTYPRTYDFIHSDSVFSLYKDR